MNSVAEEVVQEREVLIEAKGLLKVYGPTVAVNNLDITIHKGEILALIGANGAGKSTLIKLLSGVVSADRGNFSFEGSQIDFEKYSTPAARKIGIRVVHQELSLCKNLTVYENFYIEQFQRINKVNLNWRKQAMKIAREALDEVFPNNNIDVNAGLATLSIAQQQMVEIARAASDPDVKLLIMDEPTSSLPTEQTNQLQDYIKRSAAKGITYIYISHRLKEVMFLADYIYIMQNGCEKYQCPISETNEEDMVLRMGEGVVNENKSNMKTPDSILINDRVSVRFENYSNKGLKNISNKMYGGEIIAITGLEGNGQLELLQEVFFQAGKNKHGIEINGKVAYVAGDRKKEGIFPLWSVSDNTIISQVAKTTLFKPLSTDNLKETVSNWNSRLKTKCASTDDLITSLSGGNQQKVLIARAMAVDADIILLDDPTRGVDVSTKLELYEVFGAAAKDGKLIIWRTSDDAELEYCTRLCVMNSGTISGEFNSSEFDHAAMLKIAFQSNDKKEDKLNNKKARKPILFLFPLISTLVLYILCGILSPAVLSRFGFELLAIGFSPFIFCVLGQTFAIGLGHIDLGIGAFMGLVNVVCATVLDNNNALGILVLIILLAAYSCMGLIIYWRNIPPIIVTLGMSFVWTGIAYSLQNVPGGHVPEWMVKFFNFKNPLLEGVVLWMIFFVVVAIFIYRSRYGTVMRGYGNNETAMKNSGWSKAKAYLSTYAIAGSFAVLGGIAQSAITGASDVNASATYTMLTVAAVIIGGGYFSGGVVTHIGAVFGGISLTMVSVLLGLLEISTDYTATIQGLVLILILSLRLVRKEKVQ